MAFLKTLGRFCCSLSFLLFGAQTAHAQFVGDIFFVNPSVVAPAGGTGSLDLSIFSGSSVFGAVKASIRFDSTKLRVIDVEPIAAGQPLLTLKWKLVDGEIRFIAVNGASLVEPIGTVGLVRITFRAIGSAGDTVQISSSVDQAIGADQSVLRQGTGFGAEVNIGVVAAATNTKGLATLPTDPTVVDRARRTRPIGHVVNMHVHEGSGKYAETSVSTGVSDATE
ncbi:MAG: cohesin domain-containing protein [Burkholderiaceae bacterium]